MEAKKNSGTTHPKKEIQKKIRGVLMQAIGQMGIKVPSKKLKKEVKVASRNVGERLMHDLDKSSRTKKSKSGNDQQTDVAKEK